ncbi:PaaI family thioesterase [Variovorax paradoxus]|uniref:PaaI family thioesterase n=1 Tax=Variovorax paradoxus TaxID=34073 RepID=UPI001ABCB8C2
MSNNEVDQVVFEWLQEERAIYDRVRAGPGAGVPTPMQIGGLSGLQLMQAMIAGELPYATFADHLNFLAVSVEEGRAVFQAAPSADYLNPMGTVHGGWVSSVLDSALGTAVLTTLAPGRSYLTSNIRVEWVHPLTVATTRVRAFGRVGERTARRCLATGELVGPDGTLYATASCECRVFDVLTQASIDQR